MASRPRSSSAGKIPAQVLSRLEQQLRAHAKAKWPACVALNVRSRGAFVYVDAQGERDSQSEPLCRLRYMGDNDCWEFAYFTWSRGTYEPSVLDDGSPWGSPEACFDAAAFAVLGVASP